MDPERREDVAGRMESAKPWEEFLSSVIRIFPILNVLAISLIIAEDQSLVSSLVWVVVICVMFFSTSLFLVMSRIGIVRRKPFARSCLLKDLFDTDLKIDNEMDEWTPYTLTIDNDCVFLYDMLIRNPYEFSGFRPAYGMFLVTLACFLPIVVFVCPVWFGTTLDHFYSAATEILLLTAVVFVCICLLANSKCYVEETEADYYSPFEHFVQIPMKVVAGKTMACFLTSGIMYNTFFIMYLGLSLLCMVSSANFSSLVEEALQPLFLIKITNHRRFFAFVLVVSTLCCVILLVAMIVSSWVEVKRSILITIEKNWERNMVAIEFLLRDVELESLEQIKEALYQKRNQRLTHDELAAYEYIDKPIWMTKRPFKSRWLFTELPAGLANPEVPLDQPEEQQSAEPVRAEVVVAAVRQSTSDRSPIMTRQVARIQTTQRESPVPSTSSSALSLPARQLRPRPSGTPKPKKITERRTTEIHDRSDLEE